MATTAFGVDEHYFRMKLVQVIGSLDHCTPEELSRALLRLTKTSCEKVLSEPEFAICEPACSCEEVELLLREAKDTLEDWNRREPSRAVLGDDYSSTCLVERIGEALKRFDGEAH